MSNPPQGSYSWGPRRLCAVPIHSSLAPNKLLHVLTAIVVGKGTENLTGVRAWWKGPSELVKEDRSQMESGSKRVFYQEAAAIIRSQGHRWRGRAMYVTNLQLDKAEPS